MPFGLTNALAIFQAIMNKVFEAWLHKFVIVFFDEILVYDTNFKAYAKHLGMVLRALRQN